MNYLNFNMNNIFMDFGRLDRTVNFYLNSLTYEFLVLIFVPLITFPMTSFGPFSVTTLTTIAISVFGLIMVTITVLIIVDS